MPDIRFMPISHVKPETNWLAKFARRVTSQEGQDGIVEKIFETMGAANRYCVEFGAWDGVKYSNTFDLIKSKGWSGCLIEGNAERCKDILRNHDDNPKLTVVNALVGWDGEDSLDNILKRAGAPLDFDFASIDIDGNDWHVWEGLTEHRPRLVVIEFNPSVPNDVYFVQDRDGDIRQGCSLRALIELGKTKGYSLVLAHAYDGFFVPDELFGAFNIADNSIDAMYDQSPWATRFFYGYDGTMFTAGRDRMLWKKKARFDVDQFQIVPPSERRFDT